MSAADRTYFCVVNSSNALATCNRRATRPLSATILILVALTLVLVTASACGGGAGVSEQPSVIGAIGDAEMGFDEGVSRPGAPGIPAQIPEQSSDRQVVTTAWITLRVENPSQSVSDVIDVATSVGGRVDNRNEQPATGDSSGSAQVTIRVPSDSVHAVIDRTSELGTVETLSVDSVDVTTEAIDLDARITSLQRSVDRLLEIMAEATNAEDLITAESALAQRQTDLESFQARRSYLAEQVSLSTITVNMYSRSSTDLTPEGGFWDGVGRGWNALISALGTMLVAFGIALPWLGFFAVVAGAITLVVRIILRRFRS